MGVHMEASVCDRLAMQPYFSTPKMPSLLSASLEQQKAANNSMAQCHNSTIAVSPNA